MEMSTYIQDQRGQGELDSEGSFTLDTLAALRITLSSALPEPHFYLFQIAQGLISAGAENIEIAVGRESTRFHFADPQALLGNIEGARARLGEGLTLSSSRPLDLVLTGMATAVGSEMDRADLMDSAGTSLEITLEDAKIVPLPEDRVHRPMVELHRSPSMGVTFAHTRAWGAAGDESELRRRFEYASPGIKIAGLLTSPGLSLRETLEGEGAPRAVILLEAAVLADTARANHRGPLFHPGASSNASDAKGKNPEAGAETLDHKELYRNDGFARCLHRRAFSEQGDVMAGLPLDSEVWESRHWTFYFSSTGAPQARVMWIRNGMSMERTSCDLGYPGLVVLAPAEGLDVDASGYSLVKNEKFRERLEAAQFLASKLAQSLTLSDLSEPFAEEADSLSRLFPWLT